MSTELIIVMYHYVRDRDPRFPNMKARTVEQFDRQLDHIAANYHVVSFEEVIAAIAGKNELPPRACWLTFDDGFVDHFEIVFPRLQARGWKGAFYAPAGIISGKILDVHKMHFVYACTPIEKVVDDIREFVEANQSGCDMVFEACWDTYARDNYLDDAFVVFAKVMMQNALPQPYRSQLASELFAKYVTKDEIGFAAELYMSLAQMKLMASLGHHFGNHGLKHEWLRTMTDSGVAEDVFWGAYFLSRIYEAPFLWSKDGYEAPCWGMCYASNEYDQRAVDAVQKFGGCYGLTANVRVADLAKDSPFELPRLDTIHLPA
jgi:peptidoglycan/xylan/chitin deacetylase (PgdA/CDA1 family)